MATITEVAEGLAILAKYVKPDSHCLGAEHDVLYAGPIETGTYDDGNGTVVDTLVSADDAARLLELGWHIDSETESWARFV